MITTHEEQVAERLRRAVADFNAQLTMAHEAGLEVELRAIDSYAHTFRFGAKGGSLAVVSISRTEIL